MPGQPAAFMSYARFDDLHDDGQLTQFRERLSAEVRVQTGEEFSIFQDRNDISWGQNWQKRLDQTLDAVTLLLVIITPVSSVVVLAGRKSSGFWRGNASWAVMI